MASDIVKCITCNIVINELLCFIQNKINLMDDKSLVKLAVSAFARSEISAAKDLLFASISTTIQNVSRRVDKEQKEVEDIIRVFKNIEPDNTPTFVAKELHKLPALSFEHVDVSRVLKDIILLQSEVKTIKESYITIDDLKDIKSEIQNMRYASLISGDQSFRNINKKRGGYVLEDSGPFGILNVSPTRTANSTPDGGKLNTQKRNNGRRSRSNTPPPSTAQGNNIAIAPSMRAMTSETPSDESEPSNRSMTAQQVSASASHTVANTRGDPAENNRSFKEVLLYENETKPEEGNNHTWKLVEKRKKYRYRRESVRGKATINPCDKFKPADIKMSLFVSNVHKDTSEGDIIDYIFSKTKETVLLQKIKTKTERSYNCYKITVSRHKISLFLNDELWPNGITCRRFMPYRNYGPEGQQHRIVPV